MIPLLLSLLVAAAIALVVLGAGLALVARERRRRDRLRAERDQRTERLIWQRLDWVASPAPTSPDPVSPAPASPAPTAARQAIDPAAQRGTWASPAVYSPRRRLWRDTSAVLLVGVLGVLAFSVAAPPRPAPEGGVLAATSAPATVAPLIPAIHAF